MLLGTLFTLFVIPVAYTYSSASGATPDEETGGGAAVHSPPARPEGVKA